MGSVAIPSEAPLDVSSGTEYEYPSGATLPAVRLNGRGLGTDDVTVVAGVRCGDTLNAASIASVVDWLREQGRGGFFSQSTIQYDQNASSPAHQGGAHYLRTRITLPEDHWHHLLHNGAILDFKLLLDEESYNPHVRINSRVDGGWEVIDQQALRWLKHDLVLLGIAVVGIFAFMCVHSVRTAAGGAP